MAQIEPSQSEKLAFLKFARSSAVAADKLCGSVLALSQRLEELNIIDPNRQTKKTRDNQLKKTARELAVSDETIEKLVKEISEKNADAEKIVASLFRDVAPRKTKKATDSKPKADDTK